MSFTVIVKNEISKIENNKMEYISEICGFLINSASIKNDKLTISTENASIARRYFSIMKELYNLIPKITVRKQYNFNKNNTYILEYSNYLNMLSDLSLVCNKEIVNMPKEYIISDEEEIISYLKGCFFSSGSINDPKTSRYHLEFLIKDRKQANLINDLLNKLKLKSKIINREKGYMVYIKEAERISDFLKLMKAYSAVLYFEDIRIYRDHVNMTNRLNNCEQANVEKIIATANKQLEYINIIKNHDAINLLDDKTIEIMKYREKYFESSLQELSEIISLETNINISKSGLNHKFRSIKELALKLERNDKQ